MKYRKKTILREFKAILVHTNEDSTGETLNRTTTAEKVTKEAAGTALPHSLVD